MEFGLTLWDFGVIILYILTLIGIGLFVSFRRKGSQDLFLGGNTFGWANIGFSIFGTNISPSFLIAGCSVAYTSGLVAANFEWLAWIFLFLLAMLFIPHYMTTKISTMPEFIKHRFGEPSYRFLSFYVLLSTLILWLGGALYAGGILLSQILGWPLLTSLIVLTTIAAVLTVAGGLAAVIVTDTFQSILMIAGSTILTIIAFDKIGGLDGLVQNTPKNYWTLIRPMSDQAYPWIAVFLGYPILGIWFWCTDQTIVQRVLGAKDIRNGQLGAVFTGFLKILPPLIFMLPGVFCFLLHPNLDNPDKAFITMVTNYLPIGMPGLIVAVLVSALISTVDSGLNSFSTVFTLDIYCRYFSPNSTAQERKFIGRIVTVLSAAAAILFALWMGKLGKNMFDLLQGIIAFLAPPMAAVFLIGILWKRATAKAALSTLVGGSILCLTIGYFHLNDQPIFGWPEKWPHFMLLSFYLFVGLSAFMIVLSLFTKNSPEEKSLPSLKDTFQKQSKLVWWLWLILAVIMIAIYTTLQIMGS